MDEDDILENRNRERVDGDVRKRKRELGDVGGTGPARMTAEDERNRILAALAQDNAKGEDFDVSSLRKLVLNFEKKVSTNTEARIKHPDEPTRFLESEMKLHETIEEMHVISTNPSLYGEVIELGVLGTVLGLLGHENVDIAAATISLLEDLIDVEAVEDGIDDARALLDELFVQQMPTMLLQAVMRLNEDDREEADAVHHALGVVENMLELQPNVCEKLIAETDWLPWLITRVRARAFDQNRLYASEVLSIVVQSAAAARRRFTELDGITAVLETLAPYKRKDPGSAEEVELMENLFDVLCAVVADQESRPAFVKAEGVELMLLLVREQLQSRRGALKLLSFALGGPAGALACEVFIERAGIKAIFAAFMVTPQAKLKKWGQSALEYEEHVLSIIAALFRNASDASRARLLGKFVENDFAKIDRLVELHVAYLERVRAAEGALAQTREDLEGEGLAAEEVDDELYSRRLEAGLFTLQLVAFLIGEAALGCGSGAKDHLCRVLRLRGHALDEVHAVLAEYARNIEPEAAIAGAPIVRQHRERVAELAAGLAA